MPASALISVLARSLLAGEQNHDAAHTRAVRTLGRRWAWLRPLTRRYVQTFEEGTRPRHRDVVRFLLHDAGFDRARRRYRHEIAIAEWLAEPRRMQPASRVLRADLPVIETVGDLAAWLSLTPSELDWFADLKALGYKLRNPKLHHYHYRVLSKRSGGIRLIESPKPRLKELQRRILSEILDRTPLHPSVQGFAKGRSIVTFAEPHVRKPALLRLDLQDFFPASPGARVQSLFRTLGYPEQVADLLGGICTNAVPRDVWTTRPPDLDVAEWHEARTLYARPHLPQGAPTSPAISNLLAYRLDCRLQGLAKSVGANYTRYADDLAFSGGESFARSVERFSLHAAAIALEEGFSVNHHKTRIMRPGVRQHLAGIVVNQHASLPRHDLKLLEAILTNCVRQGPASQNRDALPNFRSHLEGRVGFAEMVNPAKGKRLRRLLTQIPWDHD
ncbi:MAG TPA: reverse transcriptase family protein [Bryobacteraceae bacterium]|jgi:hypothetical protein